MSILVDPPMWPAHGRLWAHVVSDSSLAELHAFAEQAGIPRRSFEGDHYDVPAERHGDIVRAGAELVPATELARRLSASGLRFRKRRGERPIDRVVDGLPAVGGPHVLDIVASPHEPPGTAGATVVVVTDPQGWLLLVRSIGREGMAPPGGKRDGDESVRTAAVREVAEETGLVLDPSALRPLGYERITIAPGDERAPWDAGDNHIAVFSAVVPARVPVAPAEDDVSEAGWFSPDQARAECGRHAWWPLVERRLEEVGAGPGDSGFPGQRPAH